GGEGEHGVGLGFQIRNSEFGSRNSGSEVRGARFGVRGARFGVRGAAKPAGLLPPAIIVSECRIPSSGFATDPTRHTPRGPSCRIGKKRFGIANTKQATAVAYNCPSLPVTHLLAFQQPSSSRSSLRTWARTTSSRNLG